jgi:hypothetical protein
MATISPTQSNLQAALTAFLQAIMPGSSAPAVFQGSIAGTTLTVAALPDVAPAGIQGTITLNSPVFGLGVAPGTIINSQLSGTTGGVGTYQVSISQTVGTTDEPTPMSTGITIVAGQGNRVPEPTNPYFVVITPMFFDRMSTNVDQSVDCKFTAAISGTMMTVSDVATGTLAAGLTIFGTGISSNTVIIEQTSGTPGGVGDYEISPSQTVASGTLSAGTKTVTWNGIEHVQCDFHSSDSTGGDYAQIFSTLFRDEYATSFFEALAPPLNSFDPIEADSPKQTPFISGENQYEWRWTVDCRLNGVQVTSVPQQYSDSATVDVVDVTAEYPI